jgi:uncharacterized protein (TIGR02266 family)
MSSYLALAGHDDLEPAPAAGPERRVHERVDVEVAVTFESDHNFYTGLTCDISAGGLFVATHVLRPPGTRLRVRFALPGLEQPIETEVEVRWVRDSGFSTLPPGMGLRFLQLPAPALLAVAHFIQCRDTIFYDD